MTDPTHDITDQFASECLDIFYRTNSAPIPSMRAVLVFAFGYRGPVIDANPADAAVEALFTEIRDVWVSTPGTMADALRAIVRHVLTRQPKSEITGETGETIGKIANLRARLDEAKIRIAALTRQPKPEDVDRLAEVLQNTVGPNARLTWSDFARAILALYPAPPDYAAEIERLTARVRELEALTVEPPVGTIRLGDGLTEAQKAMSVRSKLNDADRISQAVDCLVRSFMWEDTLEGPLVWERITTRLSDVANALRASATPKPEAVDWVKIVEECHHNGWADWDRATVINGLCEQIAALRAAGEG
jgi:hypothetical protein